MLTARVANFNAMETDKKTLTHQDLININSIIENIFTSLESVKRDLTQTEKEELLKFIEDQLQTTQEAKRYEMFEQQTTRFISNILRHDR